MFTTMTYELIWLEGLYTSTSILKSWKSEQKQYKCILFLIGVLHFPYSEYGAVLFMFVSLLDTND